MEGFDETECSKTSLSEKNDQEGDNEESCKLVKDGGSSSNSMLEESEKKSSVRPYVRSKMPRLRWNSDLHVRFVNAIERLGGYDRATPKLVLQLMNIKGLNIAHVKSHLQMYRSKRIDEPNQGMPDHRFFMETTDRNIYNLSQLPLVPNFNQAHASNFRYGDAYWNGRGKWMPDSPIVSKPAEFYNAIQNFYNNRSSNLNIISSKISSFNEESSTWRMNKDPKDVFRSLYKQENLLAQSRENPIELNPLKQKNILSETTFDQYRSNPFSLSQRMKRRAQVDLDLSLGTESRNVDETLSLSLYTTTSPSSSMMIKKMKEDFITKSGRGASTLDLTL